MDSVQAWIERVDPASGKTYWGNIKTKETTWEEPHAVSRWRSSTVSEDFWEVMDERSQRVYYVSKSTKETTWVKPLGKITSIVNGEDELVESEEKANEAGKDSEQWVECDDPKSKRNYYFNPATGETTWTRPASAIISASTWKRVQKHRLVDKLRVINFLKNKKESEPEGTVNVDGSVSGWIFQRCSQDSSYSKVYCHLHELQLSCFSNETTTNGPSATFTIDPYSSATLTEDSYASHSLMFILELSSRDTTWYLGVNSIENMQLWLEALQSQCNRSLVVSMKSRSKSETLNEESNSRFRSASTTVAGRFKKHMKKYSRSVDEVRPRRRSIPNSNSNEESEELMTFAAWAEKNGFQELIPAFEEAGYDDLELISQLSDDDLKNMVTNDLNLEKPGHRMKVILAVRGLRIGF